ncbi:MAG: rhomboid family intramembrane serine protease [Acidobacteriota bacterium]|nr:rhomboid family intramembrane serine protease [Acidobacteriota bacterium]
MCPNCRAFITDKDRSCPYCGQQVGPRAIDIRQPGEILGGLIPPAHFTTVLILLINAGFFAGTLFLSRTFGETMAMDALGAKWGPAIFQGHQYWRLVTAGFLHGGWLHILMNSWVLYDLGAQVEQVYGTPRFLTVYFVGTVGGFYLSAVVNPMVPSLGSSAGIMGLIGAMIAYGVANRSSLGRAVRNHYLRWVVYIIAFGLIPGFAVDNWAHIGGLAGGFAAGYAAGTPVRSTAAKEGLWRALAAACVLLTLFSFFEIYRNFPMPNQLR